MKTQFRQTAALINLRHLENNARELRKLVAPGAFFCPMVKADAYGHGDVTVSLKLEEIGVKHLGVALLEEGLKIRRAGCRSQILVFGIIDEEGVEPLLQSHLTPVLSTWDEIRVIEEKIKSPLAVHVKFDTGMHRLGFEMKDLEKLRTHFDKSLLKVEGVLTHLHSGEGLNPREGSALEQLKKLALAEKTFSKEKPIVHSFNSSGMINFAKFNADEWPKEINLQQGARPGLSLYGAAPMAISTTAKNSPILKPVMSLRTKIARTMVVKAGETVSYGATWKAEKDSVIAVLPLGYADGYHRLLSNRGQVLLRGQKVPVAGIVCMDYTMIDLTVVFEKSGKSLSKESFAENVVGEIVTLFGEDEQGNCLLTEEVARTAQTIPWEIMTSVSSRVPRIIEEGGL